VLSDRTRQIAIHGRVLTIESSDRDRGAAVRDVGRSAVLVASVLLGLQVLFLGLLFAAQAVPDRPIVSHLVEGVEDGIYGPTGRPDFMGGTSDAFTECVALGTGLGRPDLGLWERTMRMPRLGNCAAGDDELRALDRGESIDSRIEYFRYWSGYTVLMRPVLAVWGLGSLHMIGGALLVAATAAAVVAVARRTTAAYACALVMPLLLSSHLVALPSTSLHGALAYATAFVAVALTAAGATRSLRDAVLGAVVGAALFNYVDLLSVPPIPWMLSASVAGAVVVWRTGRVGGAGRAVLVVAIVWPLAYLFTWASRWALAVASLGWNEAWDVIGGKLSERTEGVVEGASPGRLPAMARNVEYWLRLDTAPVVLVVAGVVTIASLGVAWRRHGVGRLGWFGVLASPALIAPLWYLVVRNHSLIHASKVYASLPVAVGVVVAAALAAVSVSGAPSAVLSAVADGQLEEGPDEAGEHHREPEDQAQRRGNDDPHLLHRVEVGEVGPAPPQQ
jgi:hypothetical protein